LAMMGVLPLEFLNGESWVTLELSGEETFTIRGLDQSLTSKQTLKVLAKKSEGNSIEFEVKLRLDTQVELDLYYQGGIFQKVVNEWNQLDRVDCYLGEEVSN